MVKLHLLQKEAGSSSNVVLTKQDAAAAVAVEKSEAGEDAYSKLAAGIGVYDGTGNIEDKIFTVNGEKFAYVTDPTKLGDDYKDVNYVKTATVDTDAADAMAKLINAKTGISAEPDANTNTTINLKAGTSNTGNGITLQIGANEGQTMNFTLDDMSADALGVGGNNVNLSTGESAKTATTTIDAAIKKYLLQEEEWVLFRTDLSTQSTTLTQLQRTFRQLNHVSVIQIWLKRWLTTARTTS